MAAYTVTAEVVQLKVEDGSYVHVYKASPIPDTADADHVKHLLDMGMIAKSGTKAADEAAAPDVAGDDETPAKKAAAKRS